MASWRIPLRRLTPPRIVIPVQQEPLSYRIVIGTPQAYRRFCALCPNALPHSPLCLFVPRGDSPSYTAFRGPDTRIGILLRFPNKTRIARWRSLTRRPLKLPSQSTPESRGLAPSLHDQMKPFFPRFPVNPSRGVRKSERAQLANLWISGFW